MLRLGYYPGCSLKASAKDYETSLLLVMKALGVELVELNDWNCCGASSAHQFNEFLATSLPARNLVIAGSMGFDKLVVPCPACFIRLKEAMEKIKGNPSLKERITSILGAGIPESLEIVHPLHLMGDMGFLGRVSDAVSKPLTGLKVACYYGCYMVRPPELICPDDPENPQTMERLVEAVGAETVDWPWKVDCCGGSQTLILPERFSVLSAEIGRRAREAGADVIVTACPLCHSNLKMYQGDEGLPVFYFTELLAAGMGLMKLSGI